MACKHAGMSFEAVLCTTLTPSVCSVIQVNKMVMCLKSTREAKHLFTYRCSFTNHTLFHLHIPKHLRNINSAAEKPPRYNCNVILERNSNMTKLSVLFLMQDPGMKFNILLFYKEKKTKQRQPPKPILCQGNAAWMLKVKPASGYGCWDCKSSHYTSGHVHLQAAQTPS